MSRKYICGGKVYFETGSRKVIYGPFVLEETTSAGGGGGSVPLYIWHLRNQGIS